MIELHENGGDIATARVIGKDAEHITTLSGAHADQPNGTGRRLRKTLGEAALHDDQSLRQRTGRVVVLAVPGLVVSD